MNVDVTVIAATVFLGSWGAFTGASGQVAAWVAFPLAWIASKGLAAPAGEWLQSAAGVPASVAPLLSTVGVFMAVLLLSRWLISWAIRRVLGNGDADKRGLDRTLGFGLGAGRGLLLAWFALSAWAFAVDHVRVGGQPVRGISAPVASHAYTFAREHNAFGDGKGMKLPALPELPRGAAGLPAGMDTQKLIQQGMENLDRRNTARQIERALEGER
ncbi:MAG: hypothetical protein RL653_4246 [Pseudomonadota bacterium]|jgi:uncharacterized membrane protein required for colicin V production